MAALKAGRGGAKNSCSMETVVLLDVADITLTQCFIKLFTYNLHA